MIEDNQVEEEIQNEVIEVPEEFLVKHPLQHEWTLWFYENDRTKTWEENQRRVVSFSTIEDFWSLYNHIKVASELRHGCDYSLFKGAIRPMWEDSWNKQGGRWLISLDKKQRGQELDEYWLDIIMLMIGEAYEAYSDEICGAVVNVRSRGDKIGLWTADARKKNSVLEIGKKLKEHLSLPSNLYLEYQAHHDTAVKSNPTPRYTC